MSTLLEMDAWELKKRGLLSLHQNQLADFLQSHPEDPYWLAHKYLGVGPRKPDGTPVSNENRLFTELWKAAREQMGYLERDVKFVAPPKLLELAA